MNCSVDSHFAYEAHIKLGSQNSLLFNGLSSTKENGSKDEMGLMHGRMDAGAMYETSWLH